MTRCVFNIAHLGALMIVFPDGDLGLDGFPGAATGQSFAQAGALVLTARW